MADTTNSVIAIQCRALLLDIEGTVSPVTFVYDVMFPFIRKYVASFLKASWSDSSVQQAVSLIGIDMEHPDGADWMSSFPQEEQVTLVVNSVNALMDADAKVTGLKQLQGLIWKDGFDSGQLVAELFPDVLPKLRAWKAAGLDLYIYSSGSIGAQKLFFGHTAEGDLLEIFSGHFDTTSGNKKETASYTNIAEQIGLPPGDICFISDVIAELDAAREAGMKTVLRSDNDGTADTHTGIVSFQQLQLVSVL